MHFRCCPCFTHWSKHCSMWYSEVVLITISDKQLLSNSMVPLVRFSNFVPTVGPHLPLKMLNILRIVALFGNKLSSNTEHWTYTNFWKKKTLIGASYFDWYAPTWIFFVAFTSAIKFPEMVWTGRVLSCGAWMVNPHHLDNTIQYIHNTI